MVCPFLPLIGPAYTWHYYGPDTVIFPSYFFTFLSPPLDHENRAVTFSIVSASPRTETGLKKILNKCLFNDNIGCSNQILH